MAERQQATEQRIDKWLWVARFYKTRALAAKAITGGHVQIDGQRVKPARTISVGTTLTIQLRYDEWQVQVLALNTQRRPALEARELYEETESSRLKREKNALLRRAAREERLLDPGRPSRADRRELMKLKREGS